jgi:hypothetical protein
MDIELDFLFLFVLWFVLSGAYGGWFGSWQRALTKKLVSCFFLSPPPQFSYVRWTSFLIVFLLGRWLDGIWCLFLFFIFMFHIELARLVEASLNERWDGMSWRGLLVVVVGTWRMGYRICGLGRDNYGWNVSDERSLWQPIQMEWKEWKWGVCFR